MVPAHFLCRNHFYSFLPARPAPRKTKRPGPRERVADALVFRRNHFCSALPGPDPLLAMKSEVRDHRESPHFLREPLLLMPSRRDRRPGKPRGQGCRKVAAQFFRRNHFCSFLPGPRPVLAMKSGDRDRREPPHFVLEGTTFTHAFPVRLASRKPGDRARRGGATLFFRGNHFPSFLPAETSQPRQPVDRRLWDTTLFSEGTTFPRSLYFTDAPCPAPRLPSPVLPLALHCCNEIAKLRQYGKRTRRCSDSFRQHPDAILTKIAEETAPLREVPNS